MTTEETGAGTATYCARHPDTETGLTCGRCGTPICPRCLVHTPGGVRCPDCARLRRPVMYELEAGHYLRAALAGAVVALPLGFLGALLMPPAPGGGFFLLLLALLGGMGAGAAIAESMSRATGHKRGRQMQLIAVGAVVLAGALRVLFSGLEFEFLLRDVSGLLLVAIAAVSAWGRLA